MGEQTVLPVVVLGGGKKSLEEGEAFLPKNMGDDSDIFLPIQGGQTVQRHIGTASHYILIGVDDGVDVVENQGGETHEAWFHGGVGDCSCSVQLRMIGEEVAQCGDFGVVKLIC